MKTQSSLCEASTRTKTANWIATNCDRHDRKVASVAERVVDDLAKAADVQAEADRAEVLPIASWLSTRTKTAISRRKKLRNF